MLIIAVIVCCLCFILHYVARSGADEILIMIIMNILCNFIAVYILSIIRNRQCKKNIRNDKVCENFLNSIYHATEKFECIKTMQPRDTDWSNLNYEKEITFYYASAREYFLYCYSLSDDNVEILLDSIKNSFFIDLNFKLMEILNKIKMYKTLVKKEFDRVQVTFDKYERERDKFLALNEYEQYKILYDYGILLTDTRHLINGWNDLLKYLDYKYEENEIIRNINQNRFYLTELQYKYLKHIYEKGKVDVGKELYNVPDQDFFGIMLYGFSARKFIVIRGENNTQYAEITELGKEAMENYKNKE